MLELFEVIRVKLFKTGGADPMEGAAPDGGDQRVGLGLIGLLVVSWGSVGRPVVDRFLVVLVLEIDAQNSGFDRLFVAS